MKLENLKSALDAIRYDEERYAMNDTHWDIIDYLNRFSLDGLEETFTEEMQIVDDELLGNYLRAEEMNTYRLFHFTKGITQANDYYVLDGYGNLQDYDDDYAIMVIKDLIKEKIKEINTTNKK